MCGVSGPSLGPYTTVGFVAIIDEIIAPGFCLSTRENTADWPSGVSSINSEIGLIHRVDDRIFKEFTHSNHARVRQIHSLVYVSRVSNLLHFGTSTQPAQPRSCFLWNETFPTN